MNAVDELELDAIRERSCTGKHKYGPKAARNIAASARLKGVKVQPYRCVFCPDGIWHVGHVMSMEGVEQLAEAIRFRTHPEGGHLERPA